jgi:hypothetical protein
MRSSGCYLGLFGCDVSRIVLVCRKAVNPGPSNFVKHGHDRWRRH